MNEYFLPKRTSHPLDQWGGDLYNFVGYPVERIGEQWSWDGEGKDHEIRAAITPELMALWAILNADGQVCNGGFSQFFYNSYGELAEEALEGFKLFGMDEYAAIFEEAYAAFSVRPIPKDRGERIAILDFLSDEETADEATNSIEHYSKLAQGTEELWDDLETRYYSLIHQKGVEGGYNAAFYRPLADFIDANPEKFFQPAIE